MILEFSRQILEEYSYIKFNKSPSSGRWAVPFERKDRQAERQTYRQAHDEADSLLSQICESA